MICSIKRYKTIGELLTKKDYRGFVMYITEEHRGFVKSKNQEHRGLIKYSETIQDLVSI